MHVSQGYHDPEDPGRVMLILRDCGLFPRPSASTVPLPLWRTPRHHRRAAGPLLPRVLPQALCSLALQGLSCSVPGVGEGVLQEGI